MKNIIDLYEQIERTKIQLSVNKDQVFSYVSKTSLHSDITDWAYGKALERECVDLSDGEKLTGYADIKDVDRQYYIKVIACMPDWKKYVNSLTIEVNGSIAYDKDDTFFEQVNLGWPAIYIKLDKNVLKKGENEFLVHTSNVSGGGLYLSELSLISFPSAKNLTQVSIRNFANLGAKFGVAIKDENRECAFVKDEVNCKLIKVSYYKDLCVLTFESTCLGKAFATAVFGDKEVKLYMPEIVDGEEFVFGTDSDDHRHDDSDETAFIFETAILSNMGNFIQLRPQLGRNHFKLLNRKGFDEFINLMDCFGMKYGLCDADKVFQDAPNINPEIFYGDHVHESYLFFNPGLVGTPYEEQFLIEPEKLNVLQSFGEGRELYMDVLRRMKIKYSQGKGLTSFGSPSLMCVYEGDSGADRITIEPVSNFNLLTGAVRATDMKIWGAHVPTDWYFGVPVDKVKSNKYRLAMQYLYLNGASYIYAENSLFKTNAFKRCDWESEFCCDNRKIQREFFDYVQSNKRVGKLKVNKAFVYGNNEFFMWKLNDRIAELKEKDWDSNVWGKWDNSYHIAWNATEAWLPTSDKQNVYESPLNKKLFSGTPYGNVDIVGANKDFSKYSSLALLGWNTMDDQMLSRLKDYVYNGGTLMISYVHFNYTDRIDLPFVFPIASELKDFIGLDITGENITNGQVKFNDQSVELSNVSVVTGNVTTATVLATDDNETGIVYKNAYGKGNVYFIAFNEYISKESDIEVYKKVLDIIGKNGDEYCDNPNISYTVRETDDKYIIDVLNMNCLENAVEKFNISYKGQTVSGKIEVGQIKKFILDK
ncbi:MAG: beta-galactosidase trimerization domain-containing protein [Clostridia bacterium]|nr:beta-galactosidase trimerization domain-containing protein [Clostridia bacterium]